MLQAPPCTRPLHVMMLTRASKSIVTRSKSQVDDNSLLAELPKKRKANTREARPDTDAKRLSSSTDRQVQPQAADTPAAKEAIR